MGWIEELVSMHVELESPRNFWYWSGLSAISSVVKDNVYIERGGDNITRGAFRTYPNIYVMLYALSGMKKGPPINLAKQLVTSVNNTRVIVGRSSIQGILKELGTAYTAPGGRVVAKSCGFICASEFASSIVSDPAAMTILTDLYDRNYNEGAYRSILKMESFQLKDPILTMLVGINDAHFADFIESKDLHGGFIGRTFIIAEKETQTINPLVRRMQNIPDRDKLVCYLKGVEKLQGNFNLPESTLEMYESWYMDFYQQNRKHNIKDDTGTIQRFGDSVLKVSMLLALSEAPELEISETAMSGAIACCEKLLGDVRQATMGKKGQSNHANIKTLIMEMLLTREPHQISRAVLTKKLWAHVNTAELDEIMLSFHNAGMIITFNQGTTMMYEMPAHYVAELKEYFAGKSKRGGMMIDPIIAGCIAGLIATGIYQLGFWVGKNHEIKTSPITDEEKNPITDEEKKLQAIVQRQATIITQERTLKEITTKLCINLRRENNTIARRLAQARAKNRTYHREMHNLNARIHKLTETKV